MGAMQQQLLISSYSQGIHLRVFSVVISPAECMVCLVVEQCVYVTLRLCLLQLVNLVLCCTTQIHTFSLCAMLHLHRLHSGLPHNVLHSTKSSHPKLHSRK